MKQIIVILCLFISIQSFGQNETNISLKVEVSTQQLLMDNQLQVVFTIENTSQAENFIAPSFDGFRVVNGPNTSSMMSIVNGVRSQKMSYTYYLMPIEPGVFYITEGSIEADGQVYTTLPIEILVEPNPDGIRQEMPNNMGMQGMQWNLNWSDWSQQMPNMDSLFQQNMPKGFFDMTTPEGFFDMTIPEGFFEMRIPQDEEIPEGEETIPTKPKKKRKTVRL